MSFFLFRPKDENPWIDAFSDPKADLQTFSTCLALSDLSADEDFKLVIGDCGNGIHIKLKVGISNMNKIHTFNYG